MATKKAAVSKKESAVREVKSSEDKSASDLEAEIAAAAEALGSAKTTKETAAKVASKPTTTAKATNDELTEDEGIKITVNKSAPAAQEVAKAAEEVDEAPKILGHKGKTILPVSEKEPEADAKEASKPESEEETEPEAEPETADIEEAAKAASEEVKEEAPSPEAQTEPEIAKTTEETSEEAPEEEPAPIEEDEESAEAARKLDAMSGELKAREAERQAKKTKDEDLHTAKIYDTKKYHVPIKVNRHHRRAMVPVWVEILILVVGLLAAFAYAIRAEILDINVPFISPSESASVEQQETAPQTVSEEQAVETTPEPSASVASLVDFGDTNSGTVTISFTKTAPYTVSGTFYVLDDGTVLADFVGDAGRTAFTSLADDQLKGYAYTYLNPFASAEEDPTQALLNTSFYTKLNAANLLRLNEIFAAGFDDMQLLKTTAVNTGETCQAAINSLAEAYDTMTFSQSNEALVPVIDAYNQAISDCGNEKLEEVVLDDIAFGTVSVTTLDNGDIQLKTQGFDANLTITFSDVTTLDAEDMPASDTSTVDITSRRYIELMLVSNCTDQYKDFKPADKSLLAYASKIDCQIFE